MVMMMKIALEMNRSNWHEICQDVAGGSILVTGASSLKGSGDRVMPTARRRGGGHNLWLWFSDSPHCDFFFLEATNLSLALNLTPILCWTLMLPSTHFGTLPGSDDYSQGKVWSMVIKRAQTPDKTSSMESVADNQWECRSEYYLIS